MRKCRIVQVEVEHATTRLVERLQQLMSGFVGAELATKAPTDWKNSAPKQKRGQDWKNAIARAYTEVLPPSALFDWQPWPALLASLGNACWRVVIVAEAKLSSIEADFAPRDLRSWSSVVATLRLDWWNLWALAQTGDGFGSPPWTQADCGGLSGTLLRFADERCFPPSRPTLPRCFPRWVRWNERIGLRGSGTS